MVSEGTTLPGNRYVSWIHEADFIRAIEFLIVRQDIAWAVNLAAPQPLPNCQFLNILRQAWGNGTGSARPGEYPSWVAVGMKPTATVDPTKSRHGSWLNTCGVSSVMPHDETANFVLRAKTQKKHHRPRNVLRHTSSCFAHSTLQTVGALRGLHRADAFPGRETTKWPSQRAGSLMG